MKKIAKLLLSSGICKKIIYKLIAKRFLAGETLNEAVEKAKELNKKGFVAILNYLGENSEPDDIQKNYRMYLKIIHAITDNDLNARISIKPSQIGINLVPKINLSQFMILGEIANRFGVPVEIDMEEEKDIDATLEASIKLKKICPGLKLRQAVQLKLLRTTQDIYKLTRLGIGIRLCKGAYRSESKDIMTKKEIKKLFRFYYFLSYSLDIEFATHDRKILDKLFGERPVQFLLGFNRRLADEYIKEGRQVTIYVPFGTEWLPYGVRRIGYILTHMPSVVKDDILYFFNKK